MRYRQLVNRSTFHPSLSSFSFSSFSSFFFSLDLQFSTFLLPLTRSSTVAKKLFSPLDHTKQKIVTNRKIQENNIETKDGERKVRFCCEEERKESFFWVSSLSNKGTNRVERTHQKSTIALLLCLTLFSPLSLSLSLEKKENEKKRKRSETIFTEYQRANEKRERERERVLLFSLKIEWMETRREWETKQEKRVRKKE